MNKSHQPVARTLFEKLWQAHVVAADEEGNTLVYIDRQYVYEVTSPQAFEGLRDKKRQVRRPGTVLATVDHNVPTTARVVPMRDHLAQLQVDTLTSNCADFGIPYFDIRDARQGIVHVVGPEQGATLPGSTVICGDSHTSTHGAFGALAWGVGTTEVEHALATHCLWLVRPLTMRITVAGVLGPGVAAKDLALHIIGLLGAQGGIGHAIEFAGEAIAALSMEGRMTVCNMAVEAGARFGLVAVDDTTIDYLQGRPLVPSGTEWDAATAYWRQLRSDVAAQFDRELKIDAGTVKPMVTWGTSPDMCVGIDEVVPDPSQETNVTRQSGMRKALAYMDISAGTSLEQIALDKIFIGSCTNARIEDLRAAAAVARGYKVSPTIRQALVVPGSGLVKRQAEQEGLDKVFLAAGFEWREPGCSMCLGMNDDRLAPGERCASTSNRNFEGRQGPGGRSHLVSPAMAAAAAICGHFTDVRTWRFQ